MIALGCAGLRVRLQHYLWFLAVHIENGQLVVNQLHPNRGKLLALVQLMHNAFHILNQHLGIPGEMRGINWGYFCTVSHGRDKRWGCGEERAVKTKYNIPRNIPLGWGYYQGSTQAQAGFNNKRWVTFNQAWPNPLVSTYLFSPATVTTWGFLFRRNFFRVSISWAWIERKLEFNGSENREISRSSLSLSSSRPYKTRERGCITRCLTGTQNRRTRLSGWNTVHLLVFPEVNTLWPTLGLWLTKNTRLCPGG